MSEKINYTAVIIYGVLAAVAIIAILYFLNTPVTPALNAVAARITDATANIDFAGSLTGIATWIQNNPVVTGVLATLGTTAVTYFIKNWQTNKLLDKKLEELNNAKIDLSLTQQEVGKVSTKLSSAQEEIEMYTKDTTAQSLQGRIGELQNVLSSKEQEIVTLNRHLQEIKETAMTPEKLKQYVEASKNPPVK